MALSAEEAAETQRQGVKTLVASKAVLTAEMEAQVKAAKQRVRLFFERDAGWCVLRKVVFEPQA